MILGSVIEHVMSSFDLEPVTSKSGHLIRVIVRPLKDMKLGPDIWDYLSDREQDKLVEYLEMVNKQYGNKVGGV